MKVPGRRIEPVAILLVEGNRGDTHLIEETFEEREPPGEVHSVQTGEEAIDFSSGVAG